MEQQYVPRYVQIQRHITEEVRSGRLRPGDRVDTEAELARRFGVSRITVTTAMRELVRLGLVYRIQGKGTFVSQPAVELDLVSLVGSTPGERFASPLPLGAHRLIEAGPVEPPADVADLLQLAPGERAVRILRVLHTGETPFAVEEIFLPEKVYPGLLDRNLQDIYMLDLLKVEYGLTPGRSLMWAEAMLGPAAVAGLLGGREGAPLLLWTQQTFDRAGRPVMVWKFTTRADRARYVIRIND